MATRRNRLAESLGEGLVLLIIQDCGRPLAVLGCILYIGLLVVSDTFTLAGLIVEVSASDEVLLLGTDQYLNRFGDLSVDVYS